MNLRRNSIVSFKYTIFNSYYTITYFSYYTIQFFKKKVKGIVEFKIMKIFFFFFQRNSNYSDQN